MRCDTFSNLCRFCLKENSATVDIFQDMKKGSEKDLYSKITVCLPIKVSETDNFPKRICASCYEHVNLVYNFHVLTSNSEKILRNMLENINYEESVDFLKELDTSFGDSFLNDVQHTEFNNNFTNEECLKERTVTHMPNPNSEDKEDHGLIETEQDFMKDFTFFGDDICAKFDFQENPSCDSLLVTDEKVIEGSSLGISSINSVISGKDFAEDFVFLDKGFINEVELSSLTQNDTPASSSDPVLCGKSDTFLMSAELESMVVLTENNADSLEYEDLLLMCSSPQDLLEVEIYLDKDKRKETVSPYGCAVCETTFSSNDDLEKHSAIHSVQESTVRCLKCNLTLNNETSYLQHLRSVFKSGDKFQCHICNFDSQSSAGLQAHNYTCHFNLVIYKCNICKIGCLSEEELKKHTSGNCYDEKVLYNCTHCRKSFITEARLRIHLESLHNASSTCCRVCAKSMKNERVLRKHIRTIHFDLYACKYCNFFTKVKEDFDAHKSVHKGVCRYSCNVCGKGFNQIVALNFHFTSHRKKHGFLCDECGKTFVSSRNLGTHKKAVHGNHKPYTCVICSKQFPYKRSLQHHEMTHNGKKQQHVCENCGLSLPSNYSLQRHYIKIHSDSSPFQCEKCNKQLYDKHALSNHMKVKHGEKTVCPTCSRMVSVFKFASHMKTHDKSRMLYSCSHCKRSFIHLSKYQVHVKCHNKRKRTNDGTDEVKET